MIFKPVCLVSVTPHDGLDDFLTNAPGLSFFVLRVVLTSVSLITNLKINLDNHLST